MITRAVFRLIIYEHSNYKRRQINVRVGEVDAESAAIESRVATRLPRNTTSKLSEINSKHEELRRKEKTKRLLKSINGSGARVVRVNSGLVMIEYLQYVLVLYLYL